MSKSDRSLMFLASVCIVGFVFLLLGIPAWEMLVIGFLGAIYLEVQALRIETERQGRYKR